MATSTALSHTYVIAVGSNRRGRHGGPRDEVAAALDRLDGLASPILMTPPLGPSTRTFANAVTLVRSDRRPPDMLAWLKDIEAEFGRRRGRRWGARVLDLDLILWSGGAWGSPGLTIPHVAYRERTFVLAPLAAVAPDWRDPLTGRSVRHLLASSSRPRRARR